MSLETKLAGLKLEHPLMNAAGTVKTVEDAKQALGAGFSAVVIGSITMEARPGNTGEVYHFNGVRSLNSLGMPNPGMPYWKERLPALVKEAHEAGRFVVVSVAGLEPGEYGILTEAMLSADADAVELNFGCPNVWGDHGQKPIASFNPRVMQAALGSVQLKAGTAVRVGVKLSPFTDVAQLLAAVETISPYQVVKFITTCNTFPSASGFGPDGKPLLTPGGGLAGMAGPAMKAVGLGQVMQLGAALKKLGSAIQLVGVGGVQNAQDVRDYMLAGVTAVQVATHYLERRKEGILEILTGLAEG